MTSSELQLVLHYMRKIGSVQKTVEQDKVHSMFKEPYIRTGYRKPGQPLWYYALSLFQIHNETLNVWTHFMALLAFSVKLAHLASTIDLWDEPLAIGLVAFGFGSTAYATLSSMAHLFQSKSVYHHHLCFQLDYIGIALNTQGAGILFYTFVGTQNFYQTWGKVFLVLNAFNGILVCLCLTIGKFKYERPYPFTRAALICGSVAVACIFGALPMHYRVYDVLTGVITFEESRLHLHLPYCILFFLSGFFYALHIPERFFPGAFDIVGHGHQWFHIIMAIATMLQYHAIGSEILIRNEYIPQATDSGHPLTNMANLSFGNIIGLHFVAAIAEIAIVYATRPHRKLPTDKNK